jgi:hypothetical protein
MEALDRVIRKGRFDREDMLSLFRHIIQHKPFFKVIMASSYAIDEFQKWTSYLVNVQTVKIGCLQEAEALKLIESPVQGFSLQYAAGVPAHIFYLTRGHPLLVQMLCYELVSLKNRQPPSQRRLARLADIDQAIHSMFSNGRFFFCEIATHAGQTGSLILKQLARAGEGASLSEHELYQNCGSGCSKTLALLLRRDLIEPNTDGYRFQIELVRRWFEIL